MTEGAGNRALLASKKPSSETLRDALRLPEILAHFRASLSRRQSPFSANGAFARVKY